MGHCDCHTEWDCGARPKPMDVPAAVRLLNQTLHQWRASVGGMSDSDLIDSRSLLASDLEAMAAAMAVVTDWAP